jgi:hypothetical protein
MSQHHRRNPLPAPCIVDTGIIVNQDDISRLLSDLCHVRYVHSIDRQIQSEGSGWIQEIFNHSSQSTLIANGNLYINIQSFDYLQLSKISDNQTCFDLVQENLQLRLIPISPSVQERDLNKDLDAATIEAMVTDVLSARLDVQFDDDEF